jgi:hypothetical protein
MKSFTMFLVILLAVAGCATCKTDAIKNATEWQEKGYETQIVTYSVGIDGIVSGLGMWKFHVEARVFYEGQWKWVSKWGNLKEKSDYSTTGNIFIWSLEAYQTVLNTEKEVTFESWDCNTFVKVRGSQKIARDFQERKQRGEVEDWNQEVACKNKYGKDGYEKHHKLPEGFKFSNPGTNLAKDFLWMLLVI